MLILSWNGKDLDAVLAFTKMRAEPVVFDVPVFVSCGETKRISCCDVKSSLIVFKCMTDEGYMVVWNSESCSNFLEDV